MPNQVYEGVHPKSGIVGTAITRHRYVVLASDGQMDHVATQGSIPPDGISLDNGPVVGRAFPYSPMDGADVPVECGAAVVVGALLMSDNVGRAITYVEAVNNVCTGRAKSATSNAGEILRTLAQIMKTGGGT